MFLTLSTHSGKDQRNTDTTNRNELFKKKDSKSQSQNITNLISMNMETNSAKFESSYVHIFMYL